MSAKIKIALVYLISLLFIMANMYFIAKEQYYAFALPFGLLFLLLYFFALDKLIWFIVFFTPLAITIKDANFGLGVSLPTEPLMAGILVLFFIKLFFDWRFDKKFVNHPISIALFIQLLWMLMTTISSELPIVSIKYLASRLWFIVPFFFYFSKLIKTTKDITKFIWLYLIPLIIVIIYTTIHHATLGFDNKAGHWVMTPFYNDHTAYGMILAFYLPLSLGLVYNYKDNRLLKILSILSFAIVAFALFLSYSRAAWLSVIGAIGVWFVLYFKIKFRYILFIVVGFFGFFFAFQDQILDRLSKNDQDSSGDFMEHVSSASNIATDASNLERINRWACAIRLFEARPMLGWGPGTYQFVYAPMQKAKEKTIISTDFGDGGNAHSEYLGPMAEQGILGILIVFALVIFIIKTAVKIYQTAENKQIKIYALMILLAFVSYFIHGLLNNFLDSDKASVPFWGFAAILILMDKKMIDSKKQNKGIEHSVEK